MLNIVILNILTASHLEVADMPGKGKEHEYLLLTMALLVDNGVACIIDNTYVYSYHLSKGYWEKSIWQDISIVTLG